MAFFSAKCRIESVTTTTDNAIEVAQNQTYSCPPLWNRPTMLPSGSVSRAYQPIP